MEYPTAKSSGILVVRFMIKRKKLKKKIANGFYYLSKKSVEQCLARPDLFDIDYDNLED